MRAAIIAPWLLGLPLVLGACARQEQPRLHGITQGLFNSTQFGVVQYAWDGSGKLVYVVFTVTRRPVPKGGVRGMVTMTSSGEDWLTTPDGRKLTLPGEVQLYEAVDGKFRTSKERVSKEDLEAFLGLESPEYGIDALLGFTKKRQGK